jgi:hypothetical protein
MISIGIAGIVVIIFSFIGAILQITDKNKNTDLLIMMNDKHINNNPDAQEMQMYHVDELREMMAKDEID